MPGLDKRRMERFSLKIPAKLQIKDKPDNKPLELTTKDVCSGGAYFNTTQPAPIGTEVDVQLVIPISELKKIDADNVVITVSGSVLRANDKGMVVAFNNNYSIAPLQK